MTPQYVEALDTQSCFTVFLTNNLPPISITQSLSHLPQYSCSSNNKNPNLDMAMVILCSSLVLIILLYLIFNIHKWKIENLPDILQVGFVQDRRETLTKKMDQKNSLQGLHFDKIGPIEYGLAKIRVIFFFFLHRYLFCLVQISRLFAFV